MKYNKITVLTYNILGDNMNIFLEIIICLFFTFGVITFCEKIYYIIFDFKLKEYKKGRNSEVKLVLEIDKYYEYVDELLKILTYGEYTNLQNIVDKIEIIMPKEDVKNITNSKWYSNNYYINVKK